MVSWDLNGKIFNRIPLLKRLKWREYLGVNALWGTLTDKNNPYLAQNAAATISTIPSRFTAAGYEQQSRVMDPHTPYVEAIVGIHNIFKIIHVQYVRRLTYLNSPGRSMATPSAGVSASCSAPRSKRHHETSLSAACFVSAEEHDAVNTVSVPSSQ